jgi:pilus assembly protein Flp/PilA
MLRLVEFGRALAGSLRRDDRGTNMVEYGLLLMLIAIVVAPVVFILGPLVAALYTSVVGP